MNASAAASVPRITKPLQAPFLVLVAFRRQPTGGQTPSQAQAGLPHDRVVRVTGLPAALAVVTGALLATKQHRAEWAGGDLWFGETQVGRIDSSGTFVPGDKSRLVQQHGLSPHNVPEGSLDTRMADTPVDALRDLLAQLEGVGIYLPGEDTGQWAGAEGLSFARAEQAVKPV